MDFFCVAVTHVSCCNILAVLKFPHLKLHLVHTIFPTRIDLNYFSHFLLKYRYLSTDQIDFSQHISFLLPVFFFFYTILSFRFFFFLNLSPLVFLTIFTHQKSLMVWQDGPWKLAASLQTPPVSAPSLNCYLPHFWAFSMATMCQTESERKDLNLRWKQHLVSDSCLLEKTKKEEKKKT